MEQIKEKVLKHDFAIDSMVKSIQDLADTTKDSNIKLGEIAKSMGKQEVILEKLTNLEANSKDSINRVHNRINTLDDEISTIKETQDKKGCNALNLKATEVDTLNRTVYGKDGRGGLLFDVEDIKKVMYKSMGFFTLLNIVVGIVLSILLK